MFAFVLAATAAASLTQLGHAQIPPTPTGPSPGAGGIDIPFNLFIALLDPFTNALIPIALGTCFSLAVIEWTMLHYAHVVGATSMDRDRLPRAYLFRIVLWSFLFAAITNYYSEDYHVLTPHSFFAGARKMGEYLLGGQWNFNPGAIVENGITIFTQLFLAIFDSGLLAVIRNPHMAILLLIPLFAYLAVALFTAFVLLEVATAQAIGPLFIAFGASRFTADLTDRYIRWCFSLFIRLILMNLFLSGQHELSVFIINTLKAMDGNPQLLLAFAESSALYHFIAASLFLGLALIILPLKVSSDLTSTFSWRLSSKLEP